MHDKSDFYLSRQCLRDGVKTLILLGFLDGKIEFIPLEDRIGIVRIVKAWDDFYGVKLSVYDRERTICDCFKYRSRLDHEIFSKALNAYVKDEKKNLQNLFIYAKKLRVYKKVNELMSVLLDV